MPWRLTDPTSSSSSRRSGRWSIAPGTCEAPIDKVIGLAQKYNIRGTPTIFLSNGERIPGALPVTQLEQKLAQIK